MPSRCVKCNHKIPKSQKPVCDACVDKYSLCSRCRGSEESTRSKKSPYVVRTFVYCNKCKRRCREITPPHSKYHTFEVPTMRYLGKGRFTINHVPYKVITVYYAKKLAEGVKLVKSVSGKFIAKRRRFLLTDLNPHVNYKHKMYPIQRITLEALPIERETVVCSKSRRRRAKAN